MSGFDFQGGNVARTRDRETAPALLVISTGFASTPLRDQLPIAYFAGLHAPDHRPMFDVMVLSMRDGPFDMDVMTDDRVALIQSAARGRLVVFIGNSGGSAMNALTAAMGHRAGAFSVASSVHISGVVPDARGAAKALELALKSAVMELPERTIAQLAEDAARAERVLFEIVHHGPFTSLSTTARFILSRGRGCNVNYRGIIEDASHLSRYIRGDVRNALEAASFCSERRVTDALACLNEMGIPTVIMRGAKDLVSTRASWNAQRQAGPYRGLVTALEMSANSHDLFRFHDFRMQLFWHLYAEHLGDVLQRGRSDVTLRELVESETRFRAVIHDLEWKPHIARRIMDAAGIDSYPERFGPDPTEPSGLWIAMRGAASNLAQKFGRNGESGLEPAFGLAVAGNG